MCEGTESGTGCLAHSSDKTAISAQLIGNCVCLFIKQRGRWRIQLTSHFVFRGRHWNRKALWGENGGEEDKEGEKDRIGGRERGEEED